VVDGGSSDGSLEWLLKQKDIITIIQHNRGVWNSVPIQRKSWGCFMNLAFKAASAEFTLMISDDCLLHPDAMANGVQFFKEELAKNKQLGAVPFYWRNWPEMRNYWVGRVYGDVYNVNHGLYLSAALGDVGYANEKDYQFYCADGDLALKMHSAGYAIVPCKNSFLEHYIHANETLRKENDLLAKMDCDTFERKWSHLGKYSGTGWDLLDSPIRLSSGLAEKNWSTPSVFSKIGSFMRRA
jgi:glycosyltransferase involved in cell wall biosynthesis